MKNIFKLSQVVILVILWGAAQSQVGVATDVAAPGTPTTTIYTPPATDFPPSVLYDNGPVFNSPGTGAGGANESILSDPLDIFGFGCQVVAGNQVAEDFVVPSGTTWTINSIDFFSYQTGSTLTSTINGAYVQIWNGRPGDPGSVVVWGNLATNVLGTTTFANIYRVLAANGGVARPIMKVTANTAGLSLGTGTYWVEWTLTGTLSSGPWAPPLVTGSNTTGNARQFITTGGPLWQDCLSGTAPDIFAQGLPFVLNGTSVAPTIPTLSEWGLILLGLCLLGFGTFFILRMKSA